MPPNSLSENLNRNVPQRQLLNNSSACLFLTKPIIALKVLNMYLDVMLYKYFENCKKYKQFI